MKSARRFLVLTPVPFVVTALAALIYLGPSDWGLVEIGLALQFALAVTVVVLVALLLSVGLLRLRGVRNDWVALGLAVVLFAVVCALLYVAETPWRGDQEEWGVLVLLLAAAASIPAWLAYAVGLLVGDLRNREARGQSAAV